DISIDVIMESSLPFRRHIETDHIRLSRSQISLHFLFAESQAVFVINHDLRSAFLCHLAFQGSKTLLITETIVGVSLLDQLLGIFQVQSGLISLTLNIGPHTAVFIRALVMDKSCLLQSMIDNLQGSFHETFLVRILDSENKVTALVLCDQICVQRRS